MINPNFFIGSPVDFKGICKIYPPKLKDIINDSHYPVYKKILMNTQEDIEDDYTELKLPMEKVPTPFEYLFSISGMDKHVKDLVISAFNFFIQEPVTLLSDLKIIVVGDLEIVLQNAKKIEDLRLIKAEDFFEFQNLLRMSVGDKPVEPYNPEENPRIKYFKAKARLRDKVKAKSKDSISLGTSLAAICCMGIGISPLNIGELSQSAAVVLTRYYQEKHKYEIDIESLLAGADSKKVKPQFWIRNLEDL